MALLWDRKAVVTFGPKGEEGVRVTDLRVSFDIDSTNDSNANTAKIQIYNLNGSNRGVLKTKDDLVVILEIGYGNTLEQLFIGDIARSSTQRNGADFITTIEAGDAEKALTEATLDKSYEAGTNEKTIVEDAFQAMKDTGQIIIGSLAAMKDDITQNGFSASGTAKLVVDKIISKQKLEFSIQNNETQILKPDQDTGEEAILLTPQTGLIGSPSVGLIGKKASKKEGISFRALIQTTKFRPGRLVNIVSRDMDGFFKIVKASFNGDTHSEPWFADCEAIISE